jgi:hypothetical protein
MLSGPSAELEDWWEDELNTREGESLSDFATRVSHRLLDIEHRARVGTDFDQIVCHHGTVYGVKMETEEEFRLRAEKARATAAKKRANAIKKARLPKTKDYTKYLLMKKKYQPIEEAVEEASKLQD